MILNLADKDWRRVGEILTLAYKGGREILEPPFPFSADIICEQPFTLGQKCYSTFLLIKSKLSHVFSLSLFNIKDYKGKQWETMAYKENP